MFVLGCFLRILLFPLLIWTGMAIKGMFSQSLISATWKRGWTKNCDKTMQNISKTTGKITENIDNMPLTMYKSNQVHSTGHVTCYSSHVTYTKRTNSKGIDRSKDVIKTKQITQLTEPTKPYRGCITLLSRTLFHKKI